MTRLRGMKIVREKTYLTDLEMEVILDALDAMEYSEREAEARSAAQIKIHRELTRRREQTDG